MNTVSTCIITKNEENNIIDVINNVKLFSDEIIVVDNHSEDKTIEFAKKLGAKVLQYDGNKEYEQRNLYLNCAKGKWILVLDADERIDAQKFLSEKEKILAEDNKAACSSYYLPIINFYGEGKWAQTTTVRLLKNSSDLFYEPVEIHTSIITSIKMQKQSQGTNGIGILNVPIYHLDGIQMKRQLGKRDKYRKLVLECINKNKGTPMEMKFHNYLGFEYVAVGKYEEAFEEFRYVAQNGGSNNILPLYFMSRVRLMQGDLSQAKKWIEYYLDRCEYGKLPFLTSILEERKARGEITKIDILYHKKNYNKAIEEIDKLEETAARLVNKYFILKKMNIVDLRLLKKAYELNPYMKEASIYIPIKRPNIYEFQSEFLTDVPNIMHDLIEYRML